MNILLEMKKMNQKRISSEKCAEQDQLVYDSGFERVSALSADFLCDGFFGVPAEKTLKIPFRNEGFEPSEEVARTLFV